MVTHIDRVALTLDTNYIFIYFFILHFNACVHTWGLGTLTASQHNIFDSEKLSQIFLVLKTGFKPRVLGPRV